MKNLATIGALALLINLPAHAQHTSGRLIYQRTLVMQINFSTGSGQSAPKPTTRTDNFELSFDKNQTLWKQLEDPNPEPESVSGGGGIQIRTISVGGSDYSYCNITEGKRVERKEVGNKKYIVEDSLKKLSWKLTDETKTILNHTCRKAISEKIGVRTNTIINNGKIEKKEMSDTSYIEAWFTTDIPVSTGPADYQGQLPGAILYLNINNGKMVYEAVEWSEKVNRNEIKEPKGAKRISAAEYKKEMQKMLDGMNNGNRSIQISNK